GAAVHRPAGALDERHVLGLADVARSLEHHVLEQVRESGLALDLVLRADVVPEVDRHDRSEPIDRDDQAEPIGEALVGERHGRLSRHQSRGLLEGWAARLYGGAADRAIWRRMS